MSQSTEQEIRRLRVLFGSDRDPEKRAFAPLADALIRRGAVHEAAALLADGLARLPDFATAHVVRARLAEVQGDREAIASAVFRVLELDPGNREAASSVERLGLTEPLERPGRAPSLAPEGSASLAIDAVFEPFDPPASAARASLVADPAPESLGVAEPIQAEAPRKTPRSPTPILTRTLGELYARQGLFEEAVRVYGALVQRKPQDSSLVARHDALLRLMRGEDAPVENAPVENAVREVAPVAVAPEKVSPAPAQWPTSESGPEVPDAAFLLAFEAWARDLAGGPNASQTPASQSDASSPDASRANLT